MSPITKHRENAQCMKGVAMHEKTGMFCMPHVTADATSGRHTMRRTQRLVHTHHTTHEKPAVICGMFPFRRTPAAHVQPTLARRGDQP